MPISNDRRHYLTLPSSTYKIALEEKAAADGLSISAYILSRMALIDELEQHPVGKALVESIAAKNGTKEVSP